MNAGRTPPGVRHDALPHADPSRALRDENGWTNGTALDLSTLRVTPEILSLIGETDEFKAAWRAIVRIAPGGWPACAVLLQRLVLG